MAKKSNNIVFGGANVTIDEPGQTIHFNMIMPMEYYRDINTLDKVQDVGLAFLKEIERAINRKHLDIGQL